MENLRDDYVSLMHELAVSYTKEMLSNFDYYLTILGTTVKVSRVVAGEFKKAMGPAYIFDGTETDEDEAPISFEERIVINRSQLVSNYKTTTQDLDAYINKNVFMIGDQLEFTSFNTNYKYKIVKIEQFDPYTENLYKLTLAGFEEIKK